MKKLFIFEGIASSGKTTLEKMLLDRLPNSTLIDETETLMPLIDNRDVTQSISYLNKILERIETLEQTNIILDRFHFTHAFRTHSTLTSFQEIERRLKKHSTLVVLLTISEKQISERIKETIERRGDSWTKAKPGTLEERVEYYQNQQIYLDNLCQQTILRHIKIDTSDKDWERYFDKRKTPWD
ncbi:MAG: hypothetical protein AAB364_03090 [Patescibacteria group bacterium]